MKVVSYGGGLNSTAMLVGMVRHGIRPDAILFADTGGEKPETYKYVEYFAYWLKTKGFLGIDTVKYVTKHGEELTLEEDVLRNKTLPSVAFGFKTCSQKFKILPQERFIKEYCRQFGDIEVYHHIGFDAGEVRRVKSNVNEGHFNVYPLIEWGWDRARCATEITSEGLDLPPKSSCFFCPNSKRNEILALPTVLKARAMAMELNAAETLNSVKGLGRRFSWTDLIDGDDRQTTIFEEQSDKFKKLTGEELEPPVCECID